LLGLQWLAVLLFADAVISPSGTGITYTATTARMLYGMERNGTMPAVLGRLNPKWGVPRAAMWVNLVVAYLFLWKGRSWDSLAAVIGVATVISYLTGPVSVMTLRRTAPDLHRPLRIAGLPLLAGVAFVMATELLYWATWPLTGEIILLMVVALPIYLYFQARANWQDIGRQLQGAWWLIVYLPTIAALSWAGSTQFKGHNYLPYGWDLVIVAVIGFFFYLWGVKSGWRTPSVEEAEREAHQHAASLHS
jgi:amino acid transporter